MTEEIPVNPVEYADHPALPEPAGYRHAALVRGTLIHTSGQTWTPESAPADDAADGAADNAGVGAEATAEGVELIEQARVAVLNAIRAVEGAGGSATAIVHLQLFVVGLTPDLAPQVYRGMGRASRESGLPAVPTTIVGVTGLTVPGALVEVVAIGAL
ncbi:enamine deaminase RidA (YjgF/YER057c/UK114 family) [Nocardioides daedukensis]|uniref:Enamine deaminase RidA (YjgF/YER057c/UK114 family) n=1 Tax=Nocardioides daedukensis TaxID=634462 RepID=A0A7Y9S5K8_9ACTN|nr:Rid family hydrolase [Nocardioides daedukensis]NYG59840.1 enamine deaminase RidA (YjgF/YER057c/UK114 family) [Nocardioides daedukensis]